MIIIGAGNLGKHIVDQLIQDDYKNEIIFFDENIKSDTLYNKYAIIHDWVQLKKLLSKTEHKVFVAIGNPRLREKFYKKLDTCNHAILISSNAGIVSTFSTIDKGSLVQPSCCISHNVQIGKSCLLHANTLVGHDVTLDDFVSVGSNVNILKGVTIGKYSIVSPNTLIHANVTIGKNVFIEPGAVVKSDVKDFETICAS